MRRVRLSMGRLRTRPLVFEKSCVVRMTETQRNTFVSLTCSDRPIERFSRNSVIVIDVDATPPLPVTSSRA